MSLHTNMLQKRSHILSFNAKSRWHTNLPSTRIHQPRSQNRRHQTIVSGIIQLHGTQAFSGWIPPLIMSPSLQIHTSCRITSFHSKGQSVCMHRSGRHFLPYSSRKEGPPAEQFFTRILFGQNTKSFFFFSSTNAACEKLLNS